MAGQIDMEKIKDYNKSSLFFEGCVSLITELSAHTEHYHHCYKIVISLDSSFGCMIDGQELNGVRGLIVYQAVPHTLFSANATLLVSLIESDSFRGWQLRGLLNGQASVNLNTILSPFQLKHVMPANHSNLSDRTLLTFVKVLMEAIFIMPPPDSYIVSKPMQLALRLIEYNLDSTLEAEDIACAIHMPPEDFRYLFVQQMSIPFAQYIKWKRIRKSIAAALFSDKKQTLPCPDSVSENLDSNRLFKQIFGTTQNTLLKNSRFVL